MVHVLPFFWDEVKRLEQLEGTRFFGSEAGSGVCFLFSAKEQSHIKGARTFYSTRFNLCGSTTLVCKFCMFVESLFHNISALHVSSDRWRRNTTYTSKQTHVRLKNRKNISKIILQPFSLTLRPLETQPRWMS